MPGLLDEVRRQRREVFDLLLASASGLSDEQMAWRPGPHSPGIGFHLFHVARWVDLDLQTLAGAEQLWQARHLAERWGIDEASLGDGGSGTGMGDDASERLHLPGGRELLDYASAVFETFSAHVWQLTDADLELLYASPVHAGQQSSGIELVLGTLQHDARHLGMIEALRGLLGLQGSATN